MKVNLEEDTHMLLSQLKKQIEEKYDQFNEARRNEDEALIKQLQSELDIIKDELYSIGAAVEIRDEKVIVHYPKH